MLVSPRVLPVNLHVLPLHLPTPIAHRLQRGRADLDCAPAVRTPLIVYLHVPKTQKDFAAPATTANPPQEPNVAGHNIVTRMERDVLKAGESPKDPETAIANLAELTDDVVIDHRSLDRWESYFQVT